MSTVTAVIGDTEVVVDAEHTAGLRDYVAGGIEAVGDTFGAATDKRAALRQIEFLLDVQDELDAARTHPHGLAVLRGQPGEITELARTGGEFGPEILASAIAGGYVDNAAAFAQGKALIWFARELGVYVGPAI